jgi:hypothetical protein
MDQEELRRTARRRHRKGRGSELLMSTSVSGSQESDLDMDEAIDERRAGEDPSNSTTPSTPTADPLERTAHGFSVRYVFRDGGFVGTVKGPNFKAIRRFGSLLCVVQLARIPKGLQNLPAARRLSAERQLSNIP